MLRIIAGTLGGRRIAAPGGRSTRPTREAVREAWFSALGPEIRGARVVDLFAGSGALGIEALSRGAEHATFVERGRHALRALRENLARLGLEERSAVVAADAGAFLSGLPVTSADEPPPFDLALADPPYASDWPVRLVAALRERRFASLLCIEHAPGALDEEEVVWRRAYGDTILSFLRPAGGPDEPDPPESDPPKRRST